MPGHWADSNRRSTLPKDWPQRRLRILDRDQHQCTWLGDLNQDGRPDEYIQATHVGIAHQPTNRCSTAATDVDHISDPEDHTENNLRALCSWHHNRRSSQQGHQAKAQRQAARFRPTQTHPGLTTSHPDLGGTSRS